MRLYKIFKRFFDVAFAALVLILAGPLFLIIIPLILITCGSPILFRQTRPGYLEKPFTLFKFRSMITRYDETGELLPDAVRMTPVGHWLRKFSLDELPQLLNVLKGDMSIVGPRPLLMEYLPLYNDFQRQRHQVKPGITGWAQVNGRNALTWEQKFEHDVWYVHHASVMLDIKIVFMTIWKTLSASNVSASDHATMPKFMGSVKQTGNATPIPISKNE